MPAFDSSQPTSRQTGYFYPYFTYLLRKQDFTAFLLGHLYSELLSSLPVAITFTEGQKILIPSFVKVSNCSEEKINFFTEGKFSVHQCLH